ncbi:MAG: DUF2924 domain-containing protein [Planctomycetes bacterium]|nr:DUF2924 domain-containing protein [Planctomycetota bacterium]
MALNIGKEIADLKQMSVRELREKYQAVFGEPTRAGNRNWLFKRIAWRIQALAEGDLSERARQRVEFLARDADLRTTAPRAAAGGNGAHGAVAANGVRDAKPAPSLADEADAIGEFDETNNTRSALVPVPLPAPGPDGVDSEAEAQDAQPIPPP